MRTAIPAAGIGASLSSFIARLPLRTGFGFCHIFAGANAMIASRSWLTRIFLALIAAASRRRAVAKAGVRWQIVLKATAPADKLSVALIADEPASQVTQEAKLPLNGVDYKLDSKLMGRSMPYRVIVPLNYLSQSDQRFPVIYLLHGLFGQEPGPKSPHRRKSRLYQRLPTGR